MDDAESEVPSAHSSENLSRQAGLSTPRSDEVSAGATVRRAKAPEKGLMAETPRDGDELKTAYRTVGLPTRPWRPVRSNSGEAGADV